MKILKLKLLIIAVLIVVAMIWLTVSNNEHCTQAGCISSTDFILPSFVSQNFAFIQINENIIVNECQNIDSNLDAGILSSFDGELFRYYDTPTTFESIVIGYQESCDSDIQIFFNQTDIAINYEIFYPNGLFCEPVCHRAEFVIDSETILSFIN